MDKQAAALTNESHSTETKNDAAIARAVLYALKEGCFFPVPTPRPGASVREWIQWGAMRNLHTQIAEATR